MGISLFSLLIYLLQSLLLLRFHVNAYFLLANPVAWRINQLSAPLVLPLQKVLPRTKYDWSALIVAYLLGLLFYLFGTGSALAGLLEGLYMLLDAWLQLMFYSLVVAVIASWLQTDGRQPFLQVALTLHHWLIQPIRRLLPPLGMLDFSPLVALLIIEGLRWLLNLLLGG